MTKTTILILSLLGSPSLLAAGSATGQLDRILERASQGGSLEKQAANARFEESLGAAPVMVAAPATQPSPSPALRAPSPGSAGRGGLLEKARIMQERTDLEHRPWLGLVLSRRVNDKGEFQRWDNFGDSLIWTGNYVASQAYRYAVTHDEEALKNMEQSLWGLHADQAATGIPGFVARVVVPKSEAAKVGFDIGKTRHEGAGEYKDYIWEGNVSLDAYTGYIYGMAAAWPYIRDPKLRETVREDLRQLGLHIIRNDMRIVGPDTFLDFRANYYYQERLPKAIRGLPVPPWRAGNSIHGLHIMKVCAEITGDPRLQEYYEQEMILNQELDLKILNAPSLEKLIDKHKGMIGRVASVYSGEKVEARTEWLRSDIGRNLEHMALHDLNKLERDPDLRKSYQQAFREEHDLIRGESNSFWNFLYAAQTPGEDKEAADGVESLRRFPMRKVIGPVKNTCSENPPADRCYPQHKGLHGDTLFPWRWFTDEPLPFEKRTFPAAWLWQSNPYELDGGESPDDQGSGTAYLGAYWLGRYHGFIQPDE